MAEKVSPTNRTPSSRKNNKEVLYVYVLRDIKEYLD